MPARCQPDDRLLLPFQRAWVRDPARLKLAEKARQIGWTWATAYGLVRRKVLGLGGPGPGFQISCAVQRDWATHEAPPPLRGTQEEGGGCCKSSSLLQPRRQTSKSGSGRSCPAPTPQTPGPKCDAWISSRDEIQARLFLEDCRHFLQLLHDPAAKDLCQRALVQGGQTAYVLQLANGLRLHSMSSNPDAQAGKRGDRILDEFALHPDPRRLYAIAYPGITWGGALEIFSTHRGSANFFNQLVNEARYQGNPKGFSLHRVTLQDALEQGFLFKLQQKLPPDDERQAMDEAAYYDFIRQGCPDEETFQQEYCCNPSDDQSAFLSYELITGCEDAMWGADSPVREAQSPADKAVRAPADMPLYLGVDVGRDHDLTVLWVLEQAGDVARTVAVECLQNQPFDAQEAALAAWLEQPALARCCIDATGLGRQFAERAQQRFGAYRVEAVHFTGAVKEELAYPVRVAFERCAVRIPEDRFIRADLRAVKKETTASGNIRFSADRGKNGHADRFWALALALHAAAVPAGAGPIHVFSGGRRARALAARRARALPG
ncbi:MAG: hypothetical protein NTW03_16130 [Verrucomicrobia bacterium]|nr:hypothetical protein [Verrucomicrobiota bacterium]